MCGVTKLATSVSQVDVSRYGHIFLILWMFHIATLHFMVACFTKFKFSSIHETSYLATLVLSTLSSVTLISVVSHFLSCCLLPKIINSIFCAFIFSLFSFIQAPMFIRQVSISLTTLCSSAVSLTWNTFEGSGHLQTHLCLFHLEYNLLMY